MLTQQQLLNTGTSDKPGERAVCPRGPTPHWVRALPVKLDAYSDSGDVGQHVISWKSDYKESRQISTEEVF